METTPTTSAPLRVRISKSQERFKRARDVDNNGSGMGHFSLHLAVTALTETVYIPLSISSGKKPTGFVYQIEGTGESGIVTTDISLRDVKKSGITQILLGTIAYVEIPKGMTALLHVVIDMRGRVGKEYAIAITQIKYKHHPSDARYQKYVEEIRTATLAFR